MVFVPSVAVWTIFVDLVIFFSFLKAVVIEILDKQMSCPHFIYHQMINEKRGPIVQEPSTMVAYRMLLYTSCERSHIKRENTYGGRECYLLIVRQRRNLLNLLFPWSRHLSTNFIIVSLCVYCNPKTLLITLRKSSVLKKSYHSNNNPLLQWIIQSRSNKLFIVLQYAKSLYMCI